MSANDKQVLKVGLAAAAGVATFLALGLFFGALDWHNHWLTIPCLGGGIGVFFIVRNQFKKHPPDVLR